MREVVTLPTTIPDIPAWLAAMITAAAGAVFGWLTGRRGANASASKTEADAAQVITKTATEFAEVARRDEAEARRLAADANARSERLQIELTALRLDFDRVLLPLASHVMDWDRDCARCETRPPLPPSLAERLRKLNKSGSGEH